MFRLFIKNRQCKHVIFGGCHDRGYVSMLEAYRNASHLTLLEAAKSAPEFSALPFKRCSFPTVFQSEHSTIHRPVTLSPKHRLPIRSKVDKNQRGSQGEYTSQDLRDICHKYIILNRHGQRLDPKLPPFPKEDYKALRLHMRKFQPCYDHLLLGACPSPRSHCSFSHDPIPLGQELCLRYILRNVACPHGSACRSLECYHGHRCPHVRCYFGESCHLAATHGIDSTEAKRIYLGELVTEEESSRNISPTLNAPITATSQAPNKTPREEDSSERRIPSTERPGPPNITLPMESDDAENSREQLPVAQSAYKEGILVDLNC